jgi:hypothetical protein
VLGAIKKRRIDKLLKATDLEKLSTPKLESWRFQTADEKLKLIIEDNADASIITIPYKPPGGNWYWYLTAAFVILGFVFPLAFVLAFFYIALGLGIGEYIEEINLCSTSVTFKCRTAARRHKERTYSVLDGLIVDGKTEHSYIWDAVLIRHKFTLKTAKLFSSRVFYHCLNPLQGEWVVYQLNRWAKRSINK